ncbi:TetR/AcrR family transcriptional regulator [Actinoallomurus purpureus]|uniref:TetR/AcrR family transcriptional regulator n=1 Tax=Actinoallomurus purpureus TaxID=478114 RepID=UPI00209266C9|nr:TetR/AcrR family transcriptional regulator [Actinoallomurus purpureus]MCO6008926.1 TetR/AcrR family transcriptional regulator [Actinoallomurus purpureus]
MSRGQRGRDRSLTRDRIIDVALRIADNEADLDRLTVRRLAGELNVGTMTLYGYFHNKDEILDAMGDRVLGGMHLPDEPDAGPAEALHTVAHAFSRMMREHPSVVRLLTTRITDSRRAVGGAMEAVLQRLVDAGIPGPLAVRCYGFLITYTIGFAGYQVPRRWGRADAADGAEARRRRRHFYHGLPTEDFPQVVSLVDEIVELPSDEQFASGLAAYIDGMLHMLTRAGVKV